jgi:hypothetical protein
MTGVTDRFKALLAADRPDAGEIAALLDRASASERLEAVRSLGGVRLQRRLWESASGGAPVTIDDLVPPDAAPLAEVVYEGKNSLPAFTIFQKRFCRPSTPEERSELWGYNHTSIGRFVGPGYFVCHAVGAERAAIDYRALPPAHPAHWPEIRPNSQGLSWFVYRDMVDYLRRVSQHVFIGSASRHGKDLGSYFVLCRTA